MLIGEAIKKALEEDKYIHQRKYPAFKILPNHGAPFSIHATRTGVKLYTCWNPTAKDILDDDWELID